MPNVAVRVKFTKMKKTYSSSCMYSVTSRMTSKQSCFVFKQIKACFIAIHVVESDLLESVKTCRYKFLYETQNTECGGNRGRKGR